MSQATKFEFVSIQVKRMFSEKCDFSINTLRINQSTLEKLELEKEFLIYLNNERILQDLQQAAIEYEKTVITFIRKESILPPFRFRLKLDMMKIQETSEKLYYLFLKEPGAGMDIAVNVIYCALSFMIISVEITKSDLQIVPLVTHLPITNKIIHLLYYPSYGLETIRGILIEKSSIIKTIRSIVYRCDCSGSKWRREPGNHKNVCPECSNVMEEDVLSSDTGEEIICQFTTTKPFENIGIFQGLKVRIRDELCSLNIQIGEEYLITGKLNANFFEALNIQPKESEPGFFFNFALFNVSIIPKTILDMHLKISENHPGCPWSFVLALSSSLGSNLIPISSFLNLKMGLILSLSTQRDEENPVPLVAIGSDSLNTQYLFKKAGKLAEKYISYSVSQSYLGGAIKYGFQSDAFWEEAGQLVLAAKGVCDFGDWSKLKKEQANYICQTMESRQIALNKGELGKKNLNFVPLKCSVWAYWCHVSANKSDQLQLKTLINVFGIPFLAEEKDETEIKKICWKNLQKATGSDKENDEDFILFEDLKNFIAVINRKEIIIPEPATQLIRSYFVTSRRERPYCLPISAIKTIASLAQAHARLSLKDEASYEDVIAIIYLYEEAISTLFGRSTNSFQKLVWDQSEPFYVFMSKQLCHFKIWLEKYILT